MRKYWEELSTYLEQVTSEQGSSFAALSRRMYFPREFLDSRKGRDKRGHMISK